MAFTSDENVRLSIEEWKLMAGRLPGGVNTQADGVGAMRANVVPPFLNLSTPERRAVDEAGAWDLAKVDAPALGMRPKMFGWIDNMDLWHGDSYGYVGYVACRAAGVPGNGLRAKGAE